MWNKKHVKLLLTLFFIGAAGIIFYINYQNRDEGIIVNRIDETSVPAESKEERAFAKPDSTEYIYVHVCGEVKKPGVYKLSCDARIVDAIELAGGFKNEAAGEYINQAERLSDGQRIYIPSINDIKKGEDVKSDTSGNTSDSAESKSDGRVNINTATIEELTTISGIGQSRAESIITYREEHGKFESIEAIMNVTGIKQGLFNKISDFITI